MTVPKRFDILRFFSGLLKVLAWITLVLAILGAIFVALAGGQMGGALSQAATGQLGPAAGLMAGLGGIAVAIGMLIVGVFYFIVLYATGELIALLIAMEENTRLGAALLLKMHQDNQVDTHPATYPGAFANEPAPYK